MADKTMSAAELLELIKSGGKIKVDHKPMVIEQMGDLLEKLGEIILADEKRTQADLSRSQANLEVLATMQALVRQNKSKTLVSHETIDLAPLQKILIEIQEANAYRDALSYEVAVHRTVEGGPMQRAIITPIPPTRH